MASDVKVAANEDGGAVIGSYVVTDVDASGTLAFTITEQPDEGTVTDNSDGTFSFNPGAGFQELAEGETTQVIFRYTATDASGAASQEAIGVVTDHWRQRRSRRVGHQPRRHRRRALDHRRFRG